MHSFHHTYIPLKSSLVTLDSGVQRDQSRGLLHYDITLVHSITLSYDYTNILIYYYTMILHYYTVTLSYCHTITLSYYYTNTLIH